jgi:hypothetical protein
LFGNKASNGVVLVTTKKRKKKGFSKSIDVYRNRFKGYKEYDRLNPSDYYEAFLGS